GFCYVGRAPRRGARGGDRYRFAAAAALRSIPRVIDHCCAIDKVLLTHQYSTRPAGKKNIIPPKTSGMIIMTLAWMGSGGVGFSLICRNMVAIITAGRMKYGSRTERSCTH